MKICRDHFDEGPVEDAGAAQSNQDWSPCADRIPLRIALAQPRRSNEDDA
jgi:hypothetical protein